MIITILLHPCVFNFVTFYNKSVPELSEQLGDVYDVYVSNGLSWVVMQLEDLRQKYPTQTINSLSTDL